MASVVDETRDAAMARYSRLEAEFTSKGGYAAEAEAGRIAGNLGLPERVLGQALRTLSGGQRRRVELARILFSGAQTLLLDEPTNHLDAESVAWLERFLEAYKGTVVAVTHDRYFLDNVAGWILELDRGKGLPFEGNYSSWLEQKQARLAVEESRSRPGVARSPASSSGFARPQPRDRPSPRRASASSRSFRKRRPAANLARHRSSSRCPNALAATSSRRRA